MNSILSYLKNKRLVWQANHQQALPDVASSGYDDLDSELQGGFPHTGVIDIHSPFGIGELRLFLPHLRQRQEHHQKLMIFIAPPMLVNSEMLAHYGFSLEQVLVLQPNSPEDALWSAEQCLKSGSVHSVLIWHQSFDIAQIKRLQMAADNGDALMLIFRQQKTDALSLPVSLAMRLNGHPQGLEVEITKRKGAWPSKAFTLDMHRHWPDLTTPPSASNVISFPASVHSRTG